MPINVDIQQTLALLGLKNLEIEQMRSQIDQVVDAYNKLKDENEELKRQLEAFNGRLVKADTH